MHNILRLTALILALITAISLYGCTQQPSVEEQPVQSAATPSRTLHEAAENHIGARYTFTLQRLTEMFNEGIAEQEHKPEQLSYENWRLLSQDMVDDKNVAYSTYYYQLGTITFTAAVENESRKVMNIGCGCDTELLEQEEYRKGFVRLTAIVARMAGGYNAGDTAFLEKLCGTLLDQQDNALYYESALYIKSEENGSIVLMVSPSDAASAARQEIKHYTAE